MSAPESSTPAPSPAPNPVLAPRKRRRWRVALRSAVLLFATAPLVFAFIAALMLIGQEVTAPSWLTARIEDRAAEVLDGGSLSFGEITVTLSSDLHLTVIMRNTVFRDASNAAIARVPEIAVEASRAGLLSGEFRPETVLLDGLQVALRREADGRVALAFDGAGVQVGEAANFAALADALDTAFERPALAALQEVQARGVIVNFDDARAGRSFTFDGGEVTLDLREDLTSLRGSASLLSGRSSVTTIDLAYDSPRALQNASVAISVNDIAAADIATQSAALSWLGVLDAPLSATLRGTITEAGRLGPLSATLDIAAGALRPVSGAEPVPFEAASAAFTYDPATEVIGFDRVAVRSDWGAVTAEGTAQLLEMRGGLPGSLVGQFRLSDIAVNPRGIYDDAQQFNAASVDFRLGLSPFAVEIGAVSVQADDFRLNGAARIGADAEGWRVAVDGQVASLSDERLLALWPVGFRPGTRNWFVENLTTGTLTDIAVNARIAPETANHLSVGFEYRDTILRPLRHMPPVTGAAGFVRIDGNALAVVVDQGQMRAPQGGMVDLAGSVFQIPDTSIPQPPATITIKSDSTITAALSLLDLPPWNFIGNAGQQVTLADGRARAEGQVSLPLRGPGQGQPPELSFAFDGALSGLRSETLIAGRVLTASNLDVSVDNSGLEIGGPVQLGRVPADIVWSQPFGPDAGGRSQLNATVELSERFTDEFGIGLPQGTLSGAGTGAITVDLVPGQRPAFTLASQLGGIGLRLPALNWSKPASSRGSLEVAGTLGAVPRISRLALEANGLRATGAVMLNDSGQLARAAFSRVRLDDWLDVAVDLVGRGRGQPIGIVVQGGSVDLRGADLGGGSDGGAGGGGGGSIPIDLNLDRFQITAGIALTAISGQFESAGGIGGQFTGLVNGGARVNGAVNPVNGRTSVRITGADGGAVLRAAGLLPNAGGGTIDFSLLPAGGPGQFDGNLQLRGLRVRDAPALAQLLDAVSIVGLIQQMDGQGLAFSEVDAQFRLTPDHIIVTQASAVGPGLGISLDGIYRLAGSVMDFQGVVSPFYLVNGVGSVLTRPGEGLIGVNFNLTGPVGDTRVSVNPLSALTPGMFREIFRRPPPVVSP